MSLDPVTAVLDIGSKVIDRLWPDPATAATAKLELFKLQQAGELTQITGQLEINKVEAASTSLFVAGWRPAIGWVGVSALAYQFIAYPLLTWLWVWLQSRGWVAESIRPPPLLDVEALMVLLTGILGIAGTRTFEKVRGVAQDRIGAPRAPKE